MFPTTTLYIVAITSYTVFVFETKEDLLFIAILPLVQSTFVGILCAKNHVFRNAVPHVPGGGTVLYVRHMISYV